MKEVKLAEAVRDRIGGYIFNPDEKHVRCSAMKTVLNYLEYSYSANHTERLIAHLNKATGKKFFTRAYLFNEMNWVSYEVYQSMLEIAKEITGDRNFCYNAGLSFFRFNKGGLITLGKYLGSPPALYRSIPTFVAKYNNQIILRVVEVKRNRATITMSLKPFFRRRAAQRKFFHKNGCDIVKGVLQSIPTLFDYGRAEVVDAKCMGLSDELCEWKFVWKEVSPVKRMWQSIVASDYKKLMKEQNEELSRTIAELERKYEELLEKNREIMNYQEQLIEKEKLESAVRLLSDLAHDIKTPLTMISGYAQLTKAGVSPEDAEEYSGMIIEQSERTVSIIQDLLNYLRGKPPVLNKQVTNAKEFLMQFHGEIQPGFSAKRIETKFISSLPADACFLIDAGSFRRAIYNICKNAREAMQDGGLLTIEANASGEYIHLLFTDSGIGIPEEQQKNIFTRFSSSKLDGTGLGMGIAKSIVEAHNGEIGFKSKEGKGTTIAVKIPVLKD